jgi:hypothetical protein
VHLEEHVAELVEQLRVVAGVGRVGELIGLLDGVRDDRALVLLAVPWTLAAQPARQLIEAADCDRRWRRHGGYVAEVEPVAPVFGGFEQYVATW